MPPLQADSYSRSRRNVEPLVFSLVCASRVCASIRVPRIGSDWPPLSLNKKNFEDGRKKF